MAHTEQRNFCKSVKAKYPDFFKNKKVLDIGSLDINGSNRDLFENCDYIGLDVGEGKNVDIISIGHLFIYSIKSCEDSNCAYCKMKLQ